jgi:DNA-binding winged helix-turn-helix (wHTH) protein
MGNGPVWKGMHLRFGDFRLDAGARQLFRADIEVHLSPKAFDLLRMLLEARPNALSKTELMERLWPGTFVSEANLSVLVAEIRRALGDDPRTPRFVRTAQRFGYAFCGSAVDLPISRPSVAGPHRRYWLMTGTRRIPLVEGENLVGRDPHVLVRLDLPSVSRQHARILIESAGAAVEDLGSKNGTYVRGERITAPARLDDGDEIRVGHVSLTFRVWSPMSGTETEEI